VSVADPSRREGTRGRREGHRRLFIGAVAERQVVDRLTIDRRGVIPRRERFQRVAQARAPHVSEH
jgi:hypothetical protein